MNIHINVPNPSDEVKSEVTHLVGKLLIDGIKIEVTTETDEKPIPVAKTEATDETPIPVAKTEATEEKPVSAIKGLFGKGNKTSKRVSASDLAEMLKLEEVLELGLELQGYSSKMPKDSMKVITGAVASAVKDMSNEEFSAICAIAQDPNWEFASMALQRIQSAIAKKI